MTRREELQERYEDAVFALMMDDFATAEGKKLREENERLKNDPEVEVPKALTDKCMRTIRRQFTKKGMRTAGRFAVHTFGKIAMVAGVMAMLFTVAFAASETVRVQTLNLVVEVFGESTDFRFSQSEAPSGVKVEAGWMPTGYELKDHGVNNVSNWALYEKSGDENIYIKYSETNGMLTSVDTEGAVSRPADVCGITALLVQKESVIQLAWALPDNSLYINLVGVGVAETDMLRIANELKIF